MFKVVCSKCAFFQMCVCVCVWQQLWLVFHLLMNSLEQELCTCAPAGLSPHTTSALINALLTMSVCVFV